MQRIFLKLLTTTLIISAAVLILLLADVYYFLATPIIDSKKPHYYLLEKGSGAHHLVDDLTRSGYLKRPSYMKALIKLTGATTRMQAGEYAFQPGIKPYPLLLKVVNGDVISRYFTIVEGWTFQELRNQLRNNPYINNEVSHLSNDALLTALAVPDEHPEGLFYPDTYQYVAGTSDKEILKRAYLAMKTLLEQAWEYRSLDLPYENAYQALIAASIIEKETALPSERPIVASVMVNRLRKGMRLQVDPTVIYGLGDNYTGRLTRENLREDNPYNTYVRFGLPPTPIAIPSESAIISALNPESTDYFYFVARGDGSHEFSRSLEQQNEAVRRFILHQ